MNDPLPADILHAPDAAAKRQAVEYVIAQKLKPKAEVMEIDQYKSVTQVYSALDLMAAAYARYRFGEMDKQALENRYDAIVQKKDLLGKAALSKSQVNVVVQTAESIVDAAIRKVYPEIETSHAEQTGWSERSKKPIPPEALASLSFDRVGSIANAVKSDTNSELRRRHEQREDVNSTESRMLFRTLHSYATRYADYRFGQVLKHDAEQSAVNAMRELEKLGIGEHASAQFIRMCEDIVDGNINKNLGGKAR